MTTTRTTRVILRIYFWDDAKPENIDTKLTGISELYADNIEAMYWEHDPVDNGFYTYVAADVMDSEEYEYSLYNHVSRLLTEILEVN